MMLEGERERSIKIDLLSDVARKTFISCGELFFGEKTVNHSFEVEMVREWHQRAMDRGAFEEDLLRLIGLSVGNANQPR